MAPVASRAARAMLVGFGPPVRARQARSAALARPSPPTSISCGSTPSVPTSTSTTMPSAAAKTSAASSLARLTSAPPIGRSPMHRSRASRAAYGTCLQPTAWWSSPTTSPGSQPTCGSASPQLVIEGSPRAAALVASTCWRARDLRRSWSPRTGWRPTCTSPRLGQPRRARRRDRCRVGDRRLGTFFEAGDPRCLIDPDASPANRLDAARVTG